MRDARRALLDDGALVEARGRVVRRRADELDAALVRAVVRLGADERGQERVVDVDDAHGVRRAELVRDDLHVAREDDDVDVELLHERDLLVFDLALRRLGDLEDLEAHAERVGDGLEVRVVRDDERDVARQLARLVPEQDLPEHVVVLGHHDAELLGPRVPVELPLELEAAADLLDRALERQRVRAHRRVVELHALEVAVQRPLAVLLRVLDDAAVAVEEPGHGHVHVDRILAEDAQRRVRDLRLRRGRRRCRRRVRGRIHVKEAVRGDAHLAPKRARGPVW
mmetsp:Transcript_6847/g.21581  ORF Transcript_6847/g.21581 Transcript_6847/m.21581 type:complete len:282 (+) Transcript_6847:292-1137(+)